MKYRHLEWMERRGNNSKEFTITITTKNWTNIPYFSFVLPSVMFAADAGRQLFTEEVFEQQLRLPGGAWVPAPNSWTDARNDPATSRDEIGLPEGWAWRDLWSVRSTNYFVFS